MAKQFIKQRTSPENRYYQAVENNSSSREQDQKTDITKLWRTIHQAENKTRKQILPSCGEQFIKQRTRPENRYYQAVENN